MAVVLWLWVSFTHARAWHEHRRKALYMACQRQRTLHTFPRSLPIMGRSLPHCYSFFPSYPPPRRRNLIQRRWLGQGQTRFHLGKHLLVRIHLSQKGGECLGIKETKTLCFLPPDLPSSSLPSFLLPSSSFPTPPPAHPTRTPRPSTQPSPTRPNPTPTRSTQSGRPESRSSPPTRRCMTRQGKTGQDATRQRQERLGRTSHGERRTKSRTQSTQSTHPAGQAGADKVL